jgi:dienelactone hydrolase
MVYPHLSLLRHARGLVLVGALALAGVIGFGEASAQTPGPDAPAQLPFERVEIAIPGVSIKAALYRPDGPGPFPAVIALHGCGGLWNKAGQPSVRHADWGERLAKQGFMVVMPDSFGSRGLGSQCGVTDRQVRASKERVADVHGVKAWLQKRFDVKPEAVSLLGWSNGGTTVLTAMRADKKPNDGLPDLAAGVAFYPGCRASYESSSYRLRMPLLILMGSEDDWTPLGPCEGLVTASRGRGEPMDIQVYPGAVHDFDHPSLELREREGLAFTADGTGKARVGTDPQARADAIERVPKFLAR